MTDKKEDPKYETREALPLLIAAHGRYAKSEHQAARQTAARKLIEQVAALAQEARFAVSEDHPGQLWIGLNERICVNIGAGQSDEPWLRQPPDDAVKLDIEYDANVKMFVGTKLESFAEPGQPARKRKAVTVFVEKMIELLDARAKETQR